MAMVPSLVSYEGSLMDKLNTKSPIWKYFGFVPDNNGKPSNTEKPQCKICHATVTTLHQILVKRNAAHWQVRLPTNNILVWGSNEAQ